MGCTRWEEVEDTRCKLVGGEEESIMSTCLSGGVNRLDRECMEKKSESGMLEKARSYLVILEVREYILEQILSAIH